MTSYVDIDAIRRRADAATPGPWQVELLGTQGYPQRVTTPGALLIAETYTSPRHEPADVEFIAHAREDVPALLDEIERLTSTPAPAGEPVPVDRLGAGLATALDALADLSADVSPRWLATLTDRAAEVLGGLHVAARTRGWRWETGPLAAPAGEPSPEGSPTEVARRRAEIAQLRSAQGWDPGSPQWRVIRAAIAAVAAIRDRQALTRSEVAELTAAVDDLPHIGEPEASVPLLRIPACPTCGGEAVHQRGCPVAPGDVQEDDTPPVPERFASVPPAEMLTAIEEIARTGHAHQELRDPSCTGCRVEEVLLDGPQGEPPVSPGATPPADEWEWGVHSAGEEPVIFDSERMARHSRPAGDLLVRRRPGGAWQDVDPADDTPAAAPEAAEPRRCGICGGALHGGDPAGRCTTAQCPDHPGDLDDARDHVCRLRPTSPGLLDLLEAARLAEAEASAGIAIAGEQAPEGGEPRG